MCQTLTLTLTLTLIAIAEELKCVKCCVTHDLSLQVPSNCRFASDEIISVLDHHSTRACPEALRDAYIVHPELSKEDGAGSVDFLRSLGAKSFDKKLLLAIMNDVTWLRAHSGSPEWFVQVFKLCLDHNILTLTLTLIVGLQAMSRP